MSLIERLREACIDWTGEPIADNSTPRYEISCGDIRKAATQLEAMQAEVERLRIALVDHNDRLRSACQVADRDGRDTNWLALRGQIHFTLAEHHEPANEARSSLNKVGGE